MSKYIKGQNRNQIVKHFELIGRKHIACDSSKFRAQNSKKNNFNQKKIKRHLEYIEGKLLEVPL